ncbi:unnamed protein product [Calypogeia fissa]
MGPGAVLPAPARPIQQLSNFVGNESLSRSSFSAAGECCSGGVSMSAGSSFELPSRLILSRRRSSGSNISHVSAKEYSPSPLVRRMFTILKWNDGRRRLGRWTPSPRKCSESGIAETAPAESIIAESGVSRGDSAGIQNSSSGPAVLDDHEHLDSVREVGGGDLLEVEAGELDVFAAATLLDGIEEKLQQLEREEEEYEMSPTHVEHFEGHEEQQAPPALLVGEGEQSKSLLEQAREIFVFAGPALGIWLSGPLMSIIDTAVIGNSSSLELAALGPGTVFCDQTSYVFMFLSIATSNLIATALAHKDESEAAEHLSRLLFVSLACGVGMLALTEVFATPLLQAFVGVSNYSLIPAARLYVQIRALAWPVVLMGMVAQSASLGMQDSWAPLKVLAIASFVNLFGDIFLCSVLGYGIGGAAWATMASQYVGGFLMLKAIGDKGYNPLAISVPNFTELMNMFNIAGPVLLTMLSKVAFYTLITFLATSLGATTLGAHQVMIGVFSLCTVWGEPLCQTAQSFMPGLIYGSGRNLKQARSLLRTLIVIGVFLGVSLACIAMSVPWLFPQIFTSDPAIISQMRSVSVPFLISIILTPPTLSCEGTLLAGRDLKFLGISMASCFCGGTLLLLVLNKLGVGLIGSWWTLVAFQSARFIQSYSRLAGSKSVLGEERA